MSQELIEAAKTGNVELCRALIDAGDDINYTDDDDDIDVLSAAAMSGKVDLLKYLIDEKLLLQNKNVFDYNNESSNPLYIALKRGHVEAVQYLSAHELKHKIYVKNSKGGTPLHVAAELGHVEIVKSLVKLNSKELEELCNEKLTPFLWAASAGKTQVIQYFLENNLVDSTYTDDEYDSALHFAIYNNHLETVKFLIEKQYIDPAVRNGCGENALLSAVSSEQIKIIEYLADYDSTLFSFNNKRQTAGLLAALTGSIEIVKLIDELNHLDYSERDSEGDSALLMACYSGSIKTYKYIASSMNNPLLEQNIKSGDNVLTTAFQYDDKCALFRYLLKCGAYIDLPIYGGENDGKSTIQFLQIRHKNKHDKQEDRKKQAEDEEDNSPVHVRKIELLENCEKLLNIAENKKTFDENEINNLLQRLGKSLNARRAVNGYSALHYAIEKQNVKLIEKLLKNKAKINILNNSCISAFEMAQSSKNPEVTLLLNFKKISNIINAAKKQNKDIQEESLAKILLKNTKLMKIFHSTSDAFERLNDLEKGKYGYKLGLWLAKYGTHDLMHKAYSALQCTNINHFSLFQKSREVMFAILSSNRIVFEKGKDTVLTFSSSSMLCDSEDDQSRTVRLRAMIECALYSRNKDKYLIGKLTAEYVYGDKDSLENIIDISGSNINSILKLLDKMRSEAIELEIAMKRKAELEKMWLEKPKNNLCGAANPAILFSIVPNFANATETNSFIQSSSVPQSLPHPNHGDNTQNFQFLQLSQNSSQNSSQDQYNFMPLQSLMNPNTPAIDNFQPFDELSDFSALPHAGNKRKSPGEGFDDERDIAYNNADFYKKICL